MFSTEILTQSLNLTCPQTPASQDNPYLRVQCPGRRKQIAKPAHNTRVEIEIKTTTGGYKESFQGANKIKTYYTGISASRFMIFKFDAEPPFHCNDTVKSNKPCMEEWAAPVSFQPDISTVSGIKE